MGEEMRELMIAARNVLDQALVELDPALQDEIRGALSQGGRLRLELDVCSAGDDAPPRLLVSLWASGGERRELCEVIAFNGMRS